MMNTARKSDRISKPTHYQYGDGVRLGAQLDRIPFSLAEFLVGAGYLANKASDLGLQTSFYSDAEALKSDWEMVGKDIGSSFYQAISHLSREDRNKLAVALIIELAHQVTANREAQLNLPFEDIHGKATASSIIRNQVGSNHGAE